MVFNEVMDKDSAEKAAAYRINGTTITADQATLADDGKTVTLIFNSIALSTASRIDVSLAGAIKDINSVAMAETLNQPVAANTSDATVPTIVEDSITHADNFGDDGYQITLEFSEVMSKVAVENTAAYTIGGTAAASATLSTDGRTLTLIFDTALNITDKINVGGGGTIKDINGNALAAVTNLTISPDTADTTTPVTTTRTWAANYAVGGYQLQVKFNESMDKATVETTANWRISGTANKPTTVGLGNDGKTATLTFNTAMASSDTLDVSVNNAIKDINGNIMPLAMNLTISASGADTTAPTTNAASTLWATNNEEYKVLVTFSEAMDETTIENLTYWQLSGNGTGGAQIKNPTAAELDNNTGRLVTLTFATSAKYSGFSMGDTLTVIGNITDINGRATTSKTPIVITSNAADATDPDATDPSVLVDPAIDGLSMTLTFDEVLDAAGIVAGNFTFAQAGGASAPDPDSYALGNDGRTVTITFASQAPVTGNTLTYNGAGTLKDINDNATTEGVYTFP